MALGGDTPLLAAGRVSQGSPWSDTKARWVAAVILGLLTSTFSTLVTTLAAARIGRDAGVDWMVVASIPLGDAILQAQPSWGAIAAGILFHQWADFSWVMFFFGVMGRWTGRLGPRALMLLAPPWAVFTSAMEWFVIVPFWQPIFVLEQTYWIGLAVQVMSSSLYPLFPWLRDRLAGRVSPHRHFAARWILGAVLATLAMGVLAALGWAQREWPPHLGDRVAFGQAYMRRMAAHHEQGMMLARIAEERAQDVHLRRLARLMVAAQAGDIRIFDLWWRSWFAGERPTATHDDHATMAGMLAPEAMDELRRVPDAEFDALFRDRMSFHHTGAIAMAGDAMLEASDPRLRIMAHAIRHAQRGEIELMRGIEPGFAVTRAATSDMLRPVDSGNAEQRERSRYP